MAGILVEHPVRFLFNEIVPGGYEMVRKTKLPAANKVQFELSGDLTKLQWVLVKVELLDERQKTIDDTTEITDENTATTLSVPIKAKFVQFTLRCGVKTQIEDTTLLITTKGISKQTRAIPQ